MKTSETVTIGGTLELAEPTPMRAQEAGALLLAVMAALTLIALVEQIQRWREKL